MPRSPIRSPDRKRVGDYELCEVLGAGSFATVRRARHVKTGREYAVKSLDKQQIEKQRMGKQLKREIAILRLIEHPRVVRFYEVLASKTKIYLVLELVEGGELFDLLVKEKGFGEDKARFFFRQLVEGVECCHEKGICHRDLKPENLLLDSANQLKISDFRLIGASQQLFGGDADCLQNDAHHQSSVLISIIFCHLIACGSPNYVSPEVLAGEGYDGRRADVWSIGVILFAMVTGRLPFQEPTFDTLFAKIKEAQYHISSGSQRIVQRTWSQRS
ncbi:hypothetical protein ACHAXT_011087 [Thalassiosira profunda]